MNQQAHARTGLHLHRLAVAVALALPCLPLLAQAEETGKDAVLPQVTVSGIKSDDTSGTYAVRNARTATPLDLSLRETPQSVTVITQQRIEDQGLQTVSDVINNATGVAVNQYESNRADFNSRGFEIDNLQMDGIPTTWEQQWSGGEILSSLAMYDRVEIVRGATGLMTGAGNPSAAINLVRKRATSKQLTGTAEVALGSWSDRRGTVDVSTPLTQSGNVRARVVGEIQKADSFTDKLSKDNSTFYGTVEADLTPRTLLSVGYSRQKTDTDHPMWGGLPYWYADGSRTNWDESKTSSVDWSRWDTSYNNAFANLEHTFDNGWKVRATYSNGKRKSDSVLLYLYGNPDRATGTGMGASAGWYITETKQEDAGLHLSGAFDLAGRQHEAAFGYMHAKQKFNSDTRGADYGLGLFVAPAPADFNNWNPSAYAPPTWGARTFYQRSETTQDGLYGVGRFSLADPLKLIVGARVTKYEKTGNLAGATPYRLKFDDEITPYAGLIYDVSKHYSVYTSYTEIFQPQNAVDINRVTLDPIRGKNVEAGVKGEFLDGRVNASLALFKIRQDNLAQAVGVIPGTADTYSEAVRGATSKGVELEVSGELARGWNANAGYTHYSAQTASGDPFNSNYPRDLFRVFTTYRLDGALAGLTVGGGVNWQGQTYTVTSSAPAGNTTNNRLQQDSYALVNLMARYEINPNWSAQLNVNNLTDKRHFGMSAAFNQLNFQAPRSVSGTLKYRF